MNIDFVAISWKESRRKTDRTVSTRECSQAQRWLLTRKTFRPVATCLAVCKPHRSTAVCQHNVTHYDIVATRQHHQHHHRKLYSNKVIATTQYYTAFNVKKREKTSKM